MPTDDGLEAVETCTKTGKPKLEEVRFLVNSDKGCQLLRSEWSVVVGGVL